MVDDLISDDDLPLTVRAFSSALLSDYRSLSLSLSLFFSIELYKEFFGILSCFLSLILSIDISLLRQ